MNTPEHARLTSLRRLERVKDITERSAGRPPAPAPAALLMAAVAALAMLGRRRSPR